MWTAKGSVLDAYNDYLVAVYKFNNGALTTDSKNSNTLTNYGSVVSSSDGKSGYCAQFNGSTSNFYSSSSDFRPTTSMAVSLWFKITELTDEFYFFRHHDNYFCDNYYEAGNYRIISSIYQENGFQKIVDVISNFSTGTYYHYLMIATGTSLKVYINGSQIGSSVGYNGTIRVTSHDIHIGGSHLNKYAPNGKLDEFYFWKNIIINDNDTDAFASALYNSGVGAFYIP